MKRTVLTLLLLVSLILGSSLAFAGESAKEGNWDFSLAPLYLWAVNMDGELGIGPVDAPLVVDFGTVFDSLESVFTFHFEAMHKSNWGFFFDYSYLDVSASMSPLTIDMVSTMIEAGGAYRIENGPHNFDMLGGVRYTKLETDITIVSPPPLFNISEDWYDPIVGVRYFYDFGNKWKLSARGDIGGFGVGSDFTWNVIALVHFQPWKNVAIVGGYRALDQDYEDGSGSSRFKYDMRLAGPILGFNIIW